MTRSAVPWRASPARHVYLAHFRVRFSDLDPLGHVNNAVYLNFLEQAAIDHATVAGYGYEANKRDGGAFIARRHEITYLAPATAGEWLRVTTWPAEMSGVRAYREYQISRLPNDPEISCNPADRLYLRDEAPDPDGEVILTARTEWVYVDIETGRPRRLPSGLRQEFLHNSEH